VTEDVFENMKNYMLEEQKNRLSLQKQTEDLKAEVARFQEKEKQVISSKIKELIKAQLEDAAHQLIKAEEERDSYSRKSSEQAYLIAELDGLVRAYNREEEEVKKEIDLQRKINDEYKRLSEELQHDNELKQGEILEKDSAISNLKHEVEELKGVIYKLNDVRIVLNRLMDPYSRE